MLIERVERQATPEQQAELVEWIARFTPGDGFHATTVPGLHLYRASECAPAVPTLYEPRLVVVAQGSRYAWLGGESYRFDPLHYLVVSMPLPVSSQVLDATPEHPFLSLRLDLDLTEIGALMLDIPSHVPPKPCIDRALYTARMRAPLLDAVLRLMRLLDSPADARVLTPLIRREIHYRLLTGEFGQRLRNLATSSSHSNRMARAVALLQAQFDQPLRIEKLAQSLHMSASSLHHQFKAATAMSPLQFVKRLRLHEARRLMLTEGMEAARAAHRVGYESPSQFSREYKRLFGAPPHAEISSLRRLEA